LVTGGAGAPLYSQTDFSNPFLETFQSQNHFIMINEKGCHSGSTKMNIVAYQDDGSTIIDSVTITKPCSYTGLQPIKVGGGTLNVVPNPANNMFDIEYKSSAFGEANFKLTDVKGNVIRVFSVKKDNVYLQHKVDVSELAKGVYIISVDINGQHNEVKVVVN
jgi:hypothetical protein